MLTQKEGKKEQKYLYEDGKESCLTENRMILTGEKAES